MKSMTVIGLSLMSVSAFAGPRWGVKELRIASDAALEHFEDTLGADAYKAIVGFGIERNIQGTAGNAKITYLVSGAKKTVSYFCHNHSPEEIDCH